MFLLMRAIRTVQNLFDTSKILPKKKNSNCCNMFTKFKVKLVAKSIFMIFFLFADELRI